MCTHALHRLPYTLVLSCYPSCTGAQVEAALQEIWDKTALIYSPGLAVMPGARVKIPAFHSACLSSPSSSVSLSEETGALCEQPPNSTVTLMAAEALIWQGNRVSSTELPPATAHTQRHTLGLTETPRKGREIEFNWKVAHRDDNRGGSVRAFACLSCRLVMQHLEYQH